MTNETKKVTYELVPPDGGWGYFILVAVIIINLVMVPFLPCFGMIYNDLMEQINMGSTSLTVMNGVQTIFIATSGFSTGPLLKVLSLRKVALLGAFLFTLGIFCNAYVNSIATFFIAQALIMSSGYGFLLNISSSVLNDYFLKKRLLAITLTQTLSGIGGMVVPWLIRLSLDWYGFRGTIFLLTAASLQMFVAASLLQPVAWHMRKNKLETKHENHELLNEEEMEADTINDTNTETVYEFIREDDQTSIPEKIMTIRQKINKLFNYTELKPFLYSTASVFPMLCLFVEINSMLFFPQRLYSQGWSEEKVTLAITLASVGDFTTRTSFILFNKLFSKFKTLQLYIVGLTIAVIARFGMIWSGNSILALVFITITGLPRCAVMALNPLVIAEVVSPQNFPSAMGISMLIYGVFGLVLGFILGLVRDLTNNYDSVFYVLTFVNIFVIIVWCIELFCKKNKTKRSGSY